MRLIRPRSPLFWFLALGGALWGVEQVLASAGLVDRIPLVITASTQLRQVQEWQNSAERPATAAEQRQLLAQTIDDEVLYREALRRKLDRGNPAVDERLALLMRLLQSPGYSVPDPDDIPTLAAKARALGLADGDLAIRRHLILQMHLLAGLSHVTPPTDAELQQLLTAESAHYLRPARHDFTQRYFSTRHYGANADAVAHQALKTLQAGQPVSLGDPWPTGEQQTGQDAVLIDEAFGPGFAKTVAALPLNQWQGPVQSTFGWHLIRVSAHHAATLPPLADVRLQLDARYRQIRAEQHFITYFPTLKRHYQIIVEPVPPELWRQNTVSLHPEVPDVPD